MARRTLQPEQIEHAAGALAVPDPVDRLCLIVASVLLTMLVLVLKPDAFGTGRYLLVYALLYALCYYPITALAFRYLDLSEPARRIFCVIALPLYVVVLLLATGILFDQAPGYADTFAQGQSYGEYHSLHPNRIRGLTRTLRRSDHELIAAGLATIGYVLGYLLLRRIVGRRR